MRRERAKGATDGAHDRLEEVFAPCEEMED